MSRTYPLCRGLAFGLALILGSPAFSQEAPEAGAPPVLSDVVQAAAHESGPAFWIGIDCQATELGVLVNRVVAEGPAAHAGLHAGDLIVGVGDREVGDPEQIAERLAGSQGRALRFSVLRGDKKLVLEVHPARQGKEIRRAIVVEEKKEEPQPKLKKPEPPKPELRLPGPLAPIPAPPGASGGGFVPVPMRAVMGAAHAPVPLPEDMQVTISKKGNFPATVTAKQGNKLWKTTENELDMLPPPARAYAARALGKDVLMHVPHPGGVGGPMGGMVPGTIAPQAEPKRIELRLDGGQFKIEGK